MLLVAGPLFRWNAATRFPGRDVVSADSFPSWTTVYFEIVVSFICVEVLFYWAHRLLHCKVSTFSLCFQTVDCTDDIATGVYNQAVQHFWATGHLPVHS